jgi:catechol 2,3-dioxygenase-like lactoylglutathione lyase family enzyme
MQQRSRCPLLSPTPRGIHHLALCTDDIKATIDFYVDVLGMPLVHAMRVGEAEALSSLGLVVRLVGGVWDAATVGAGASRSFSSQ